MGVKLPSKPREVHRLPISAIFGNSVILSIPFPGDSLKDTIYKIKHKCCGKIVETTHARLLERERYGITLCTDCERKLRVTASVERLIEESKLKGGVEVLAVTIGVNSEQSMFEVRHHCCGDIVTMSGRKLKGRTRNNTKSCDGCARVKRAQIQRELKGNPVPVIYREPVDPVPWKPKADEIGKRWIWGERQSCVPISIAEAHRRIRECFNQPTPV